MLSWYDSLAVGNDNVAVERGVRLAVEEREHALCGDVADASAELAVPAETLRFCHVGLAERGDGAILPMSGGRWGEGGKNGADED